MVNTFTADLRSYLRYWMDNDNNIHVKIVDKDARASEYMKNKSLLATVSGVYRDTDSM